MAPCACVASWGLSHPPYKGLSASAHPLPHLIPPRPQVRKGAMVAAGAVVPPGTEIPAGQIWGGNPARFLRDLKDNESSFLAGVACRRCDRLGVAGCPQPPGHKLTVSVSENSYNVLASC